MGAKWKIKVILESANGDAIWVNVRVPHYSNLDHEQVIAVAGEALGSFIGNIVRDKDDVDKWLRGL